jgi:hypothetical protein
MATTPSPQLSIDPDKTHAYLGRRAVDSQAALALDDAFPETQKDGKSVGKAAGQEP